MFDLHVLWTSAFRRFNSKQKGDEGWGGGTELPTFCTPSFLVSTPSCLFAHLSLHNIAHKIIFLFLPLLTDTVFLQANTGTSFSPRFLPRPPPPPPRSPTQTEYDIMVGCQEHYERGWGVVSWCEYPWALTLRGPGFYLGYLRGRTPPKTNAQFLPKIKHCYHYSIWYNYIGI